MSRSSLQLDGELTIYRAAELKPLLLEAVGTAGGDDALPLTLGLAEVTEIDTAGVQLLLLARREAAALGRPLLLQDPSPAVRDAFALLDLGAQFSIASAV